MSLFSELKRRNVIRVGLAYMLTSWLLIQVAETVFPLFGFDDTPARMVVIVLAIGLIPALILAWVFEVTPQGIKQEKNVDRSQSVTRETGSKLNRAIMTILVVALGYFVFDKFVLDPRRESVMQQEMAATLASASESLSRSSDARSIAVLPFVNMSGDPVNEPFTLGIHDDLLTHLSRIKSLKTISRTSVLQYRDTTKSIPQIAAELGVQNILEGGIQRSGGRVRINLQLIDADTDEHLWAEIYDRDLAADNLFEVQGEIATEVVKALRATLLPEEQNALKEKPTLSMEAYDLYLLGRHHLNERTAESIGKARDFFNQAIGVDPQYVLAYSGLADSFSLLTSYGNMTIEEAMPLAKRTIDQAMSLDDSVSEVWASKGLMLQVQAKNPESAKALVRAIELDQQNFSAWLWYGNALGAMRRYDERIKALETAFSLEPMSRPVNNNLGLIYQRQGEFDRSQQHFDRLLKLSNLDTQRYRIEKVNSYFWSGNLAKAVVEARDILSSNPGDIQAMSWLIDAYVALDDLELADTWAERAITLDPMTPWARDVFEARNDYEGAIEYLKETLQQSALAKEAWYFLIAFRYAYLGGQAEAAKSYFNKYVEIARGFDEINPGDSSQRVELRLAEYLLHNSNADNRFVTVGQRMLDESLSALQRLNTQGYNHPLTYYGLAMAWSLKGNSEKALDALEQSVSNGFVDRVSLADEPALNILRDDPRFVGLVDQLNQNIAEQNNQLTNVILAPFQPVARRESIEVSRELLEKYSGYYTDGGAVLNFYLDEDGRFRVRGPQPPDFHVLASAVDAFYAEEAPGYTVQFFMDESNEVTHAMARGGRGLQRFKRVDAPPDVIELDRAVLQTYVGVYSAQVVEEATDGKADTDILTAEIRLDDENRLWIVYENQSALEMRPYSETEFFLDGFINRYQFEINPINGTVERMLQVRDGIELEFKPQ